MVKRNSNNFLGPRLLLVESFSTPSEASLTNKILQKRWEMWPQAKFLKKRIEASAFPSCTTHLRLQPSDRRSRMWRTETSLLLQIQQLISSGSEWATWKHTFSTCQPYDHYSRWHWTKTQLNWTVSGCIPPMIHRISGIIEKKIDLNVYVFV